MQYLPAEILTNNYQYKKEMEIWSLGVIMYTILSSGEHPYYSISKMNNSK